MRFSAHGFFALVFIITIPAYFLVHVNIIRQRNASDYQISLNKYFMDFDRQNAQTSFLASAEALTRWTETRLLVLSSADSGIIELWATEQDYLNYSASSSTKIRFSYNILFETLLTASSPDYKLNAVIRVLRNSELKQILLNTFYLFIAYAILTVLLMCFNLLTKPDPRSIAPEPAAEKNQHLIPELSSSHRSTEQEQSEQAKQQMQQAQEMQAHNHSAASHDTSLVYPNNIWPAELLDLRLNNEIERSAAQSEDIGFIVFRLGKLFQKNKILLDTFETKLLEIFRYSDMIYSLEKPYYYGVIMPKQGQEECLKEINHFLQLTMDAFANTKDISIGYSTRNGRLMNSARLYKEALRAAILAGPGKKRIAYFKTDQQRYNEHLLGISSQK